MTYFELALLVSVPLLVLWMWFKRGTSMAVVGAAVTLAMVVFLGGYVWQRAGSPDGEVPVASPSMGTTSFPRHPWPPEDPSSFATLSNFYNFGAGSVSQYDVAQALAYALMQTGYSDVSYYSAPGGFVMITRIEGITAEGDILAGAKRYRPPSERQDFSLVEYIKSLFYAPKGHYRYITFVVSDQPYTTRDGAIDAGVAARRLRRGAVALPASYRDVPFTLLHRVDVLIYEFLKESENSDVDIVRPGRLAVDVHLERNGLLTALSPFAMY